VTATDKEDPLYANALVWYDGTVSLGESFELVAEAAGEDELKSDTFLHVSALDGAWLQTVKFHTSCSQPLVPGDRYGAFELIQVGDPDDACAMGRPVQLSMTYTGDSCQDLAAWTDVERVPPLAEFGAIPSVPVAQFDQHEFVRPVALRRDDGAIAVILTKIDGCSQLFLLEPGVNSLMPVTLSLPMGDSFAFAAGGGLAFVVLEEGQSRILLQSTNGLPEVVDVSSHSLRVLVH
jgi:hypothetical protein